MEVNYIVLQRAFELHKEEYEEAALKALRSGRYILGTELEQFEKEFSQYMGVNYCTGVGNGTDALILALRALGIGPGDEVIVPAGTYIASVIGITENGATPVFVDSDEYLLMRAEAIEEKITRKTKAILPVHLYGQPCNLELIMSIAKKHDLYVVEDCAQCHGSTYNGKKAGTFGTIACFSFYPTKPLGAFGDAGALITNDAVLDQKIKMLRNYGSMKKYYNEISGINSRMDEVQASLLRVGLKYLDEGNAERVCIANNYLNEIQNPLIKLPLTRKEASHVYHLFPVICDNRDKFQKFMSDNGVKTQVHYPIPPYVADCNESWGYEWNDFPEAAFIAKHEVSLPIYAGMPIEEVEYVIKIVNSYNDDTI